MIKTAEKITHKRILMIAVPVVLSNISVPLLGIVDTAVVGQLGEAAPIGAVGLGAVLITTFFWLFGFLRMGTTGLIAQSIGANDAYGAQLTLIRALLLGLFLGLCLILIHKPLIFISLSIADGSEAVEGLANSYLNIRIYSAPVTIMSYAIMGWLIAQERSFSVFYLQLSVNLLNIALDVLFVLGFGWGVEGVAYATLIAELSGGVIGFFLIRDGLKGRKPLMKDILHRAEIIQLLRVNSDIMIRSILLMASFTSFTFLSAGLSDEILAANQILLQFLHMTAHGLDGFAFAAETLIGQAVGAKSRPSFLRICRMITLWGLGIACIFAALFAFFGMAIAGFITPNQAILELVALYLPWMILCPLIGAVCWILDGIFIGATLTRDMRNMMLVSFAFYSVFVIAFIGLGNHGLWLALVVFFFIRGLTLFIKLPRFIKTLYL